MLGTRSGIRVFSTLSLLSTLLSISSLGRGLTVGAGGESRGGIESYIESDIVLEFVFNLLI